MRLVLTIVLGTGLLTPAIFGAGKKEAGPVPATMNVTYYGRSHDGQITSGHEKFDSNLMTAAHRKLPIGTKLKLTNPANDKSVVVTVNDRGPYAKGRDLSITRKAAEDLGFIKEGHAKLKVEQVQ